MYIFSVFKDRIHSSGTQTEELHWTSTINTDDSNAPGSPWLSLSLAAETQTADEDIVLRPFNLCNIQTQTDTWSDLDGDVTELAHTETQTLLSSFFIEPSQAEIADFNVKSLCKQTSEDASTDPMEKWNF